MSSITNQRHDSHCEKLWEIVKEFGKVLETDSTSINILGIRSESELGIPKKQLRGHLQLLFFSKKTKAHYLRLPHLIFF